MLKIEEGDRSMLKLRAHDPLCWQTESIAIEFQRALQIVNTKRNDRDPWLHRRTSALFWKYAIGYVSERKVSTFTGKPPHRATGSIPHATSGRRMTDKRSAPVGQVHGPRTDRVEFPESRHGTDHSYNSPRLRNDDVVAASSTFHT